MSVTPQYTTIVGMEVHVELRTNTKMFCGCPADHFGKEPNTQTCPVCFGLPGALPVANEEGIRRTVLIGLALQCEIAQESKFDRKNYFYPDLPKGYQISQYDQPLCFNGTIETSLGTVGITRVHLEEDTAKLQHVELSAQEQAEAKVKHHRVSLLDFNRSGVGLVEIVTEPDIRSGAHAREYGKQLVQMLRYLGVSDCDMEKGSLRLEANISVQNEEEKAAGKLPPYKVEVKNLNSFRFLERAIEYEVQRQSELRNRGEVPKQETRGWNDAKGATYSQRSKEEAEDYRYFPDPDLPALELSRDWVSSVQSTLPELPAAKMARFEKEYGLSAQNAEFFTADRDLADRGERLFAAAQVAKANLQQVANAVVNHKVETSLVDVVHVFSEEAEATEIKRIVTAVAELYAVDTVADDTLDAIVKQVLTDPASQSAIDNYRSGKLQAMGYLTGQVMRAVGKKIDPQQVQAKLREQL